MTAVGAPLTSSGVAASVVSCDKRWTAAAVVLADRGEESSVAKLMVSPGLGLAVLRR